MEWLQVQHIAMEQAGEFPQLVIQLFAPTSPPPFALTKVAKAAIAAAVKPRLEQHRDGEYPAERALVDLDDAFFDQVAMHLKPEKPRKP